MKHHHKRILRERHYPVLTRIDASMHLTLVSAVILCTLALTALLLVSFGQDYLESATQVLKSTVRFVKH